MDDLLDSIAKTTPVDLNDYVEQRPLDSLPDSTIKHTAAQVAMLSTDPLKNYQAIVAEKSQGVEYTKNEILNKRVQANEPEIRQGLMTLLADPSVPFEQKQKAIAGLNSDVHKEPMVIMANDGYKAPVAGESAEQEMVRVSGAELFGDYRAWAQEQNAILNSRKLALGNSGAILGDLATQLLPFSTNVQTVELLSKAAKEVGVDLSKTKMALLPGSSIEQVKQAFENIPPAQKIEIARKLDQLIKDNHSLVFDGNETLSAISQAQALIGGDYSKFDKFIDNISGVLDAVGIGFVSKGVGKGVKVVTGLFSKTPANEVAKAVAKDITQAPSPVSVLKVQGEVNPDLARATYAVMVKSEGDEVANAVASTSRTAAIADAHIPQPRNADGTFTAKVQKPDAVLHKIDPETDIAKAYVEALGKGFTEADAALAVVNTTNKLKDVTGISLLDNMVHVGDTDGKQVISAVFGSDKGGFSHPSQALKQAQFALREFGVKPEDLQLMKKVAGEYVPITLKETKGKLGDYLVKLDMTRAASADELGGLEELSVKYNWLDRINTFRSNKAGTAANTILDHASMLDARLTGKAVVQTDKSAALDKRLMDSFDGFARTFNSVDSTQKQVLWDVINEANKVGKEFNPTELRARGLGDAGIQAMSQWTKAWDNMYWLENAVKGRQLHQRGYQLLDNGADKFFVRPVAKNQNIGKVYDAETDMVVTMSKQAMDELYDKGGTLAKFYRPTEMDGQEVAHMIVRNTPKEYTRAIRETDQVLNYRKGYYQVQYTAPKYITHTIKRADGTTYEKAIAVAGDTEEAKQVLSRYATDNQIDEAALDVRNDVKDLKTDMDFTWDLDHASGRIAQRRRGKRLEGADENVVTAFAKTHMLDPVEAATRAATSLSNRVAMGDFIETSKARAIQQYGHFMEEVAGQKVWPSSSKMLRGTATSSSKELADARTTVEYLNYLESGYVNAIDEGFKGVMKAAADTFAEIGASKLERGATSASSFNPTRAAKGFAFWSMIANNPIRQWIVQYHGAIRMFSYSPEGFLRAQTDAAKYTANKVGAYAGDAATKEIAEFVDRSGMLAAVDRHNLVSGAIVDMAHTNAPVTKAISKVGSTAQKAGFDIAEQANSLMHLLTVRQKYILDGKDVTNPRVQDEIHSIARAITGDMNFAGDMPYNQNWASFFMQFLQYPHKMWTAATFNRRLDTATKVKLAITDAALFGVPGYAMVSKFIGEENLPKDDTITHILESGYEDYAFNKLLSQAEGKKINIDFSSLDPREADGFKKFADATLEGGFFGLGKMAPIISLVGPNGKLPETAKRIARYAGLKETYDGEPKETYLSVLDAFAEMGSSGWSNAKRSYLAYEFGKLRDKDGNVLIEDYTTSHAILGAFGFRTKEEMMAFKVNKEAYEANKISADDIKSTVKEHIRLMSRNQEAGIYDPEKIGVVLGMLNKMYADNPKAMELANKEVSKELANNKDKMLQYLVESALNPDVRSRLHEAKKLRQLGDEDINKALAIIDEMDKASKQLREGK